jgi:hypothetical protein
VAEEGGDIQAADVLRLDEEDAVAVLLTQHLNEHGGSIEDVAPGVLHVEGRPLEHTLEGWCLLRLDRTTLRKLLHLALEEGGEVSLQDHQIAAHGFQDVCCGGIVQQREQHVLQGQEFVAALSGLIEGAGQGHAQFISEVHSGSVVQRRG